MSRRPELPLNDTLASLVAVAATQMSVPGCVFLLLATWVLFAYQGQLPEQSLLPLLLATSWLGLGALALVGLIAAGAACWRVGRWAGTCATCGTLNGVILLGMMLACAWSAFSGVR